MSAHEIWIIIRETTRIDLDQPVHNAVLPQPGLLAHIRTVKSLYNTFHYITDLDIMLSCDPTFFDQGNFKKGIIKKEL